MSERDMNDILVNEGVEGVRRAHDSAKLYASNGAAAGTGEGWPEPDWTVLPGGDAPAPPSPPLAAFGSLKSWITQTAQHKGAAPDFVALALLVSASALIGTRRVAEPWSGWREPAMLWGALVGPPSQNKSPALDPFRAAMTTAERALAEDFEHNHRKWEAEKIVAESVRQHWENNAKEAAKAGHTVPPLPSTAEVPPEPRRPRLWIADATAEKAGDLMAANPGGILVYRDELGGWLGDHGRYSASLSDRRFWIEAYGGRPHRIDRKGGGEVDIAYAAASVIGGIQPDSLESGLLSSERDGLAARFIMAWPEPIPPTRPDGSYDETPIIRAFRRLAVLGMDEGNDGAPRPRVLPLIEEAAAGFQQWRIWHYAEMSSLTGSYADTLGKMPGVVLRLASVLAHLRWAADEPDGALEPDRIGTEHVAHALQLVDDWIIPHLRRAHGQAHTPKDDAQAAALAAWIMRTGAEGFRARELRRSGDIPELRDANVMDAACDALIEAGWIAAIGGRMGETRGRQRKQFVVSPVVRARAKSADRANRPK